MATSEESTFPFMFEAKFSIFFPERKEIEYINEMWLIWINFRFWVKWEKVLIGYRSQFGDNNITLLYVRVNLKNI
jgi:hypothetical protein